jgi:glycine/D-amino acid oxidase-like deaminating enzyme
VIVVAGAGAIGAIVAYHFALLGARDVVLFDKGEIRRRVGGSRAARAARGAAAGTTLELPPGRLFHLLPRAEL